MKTYVVGGAVRDRLLGLPIKDRDWVVVGATPEEMMAAGFKPVGRDFPVFLHPATREEYALARTERKQGRGYRGFQVFAEPSVTLEEDLSRRDLTINAMAEDEQGELIDPFHGQQDLRDRVMRHVGPAFSEDPVRILRVARFAARFPAFRVAPETMALMGRMVSDGEADFLVPERVWQELARGLMEERPSRQFEVLQACGALCKVLPEVIEENMTSCHDLNFTLVALDRSAKKQASLEVRFGVLVFGLGEAPGGEAQAPQGASAALGRVRALCERLRVPMACRQMGELSVRLSRTLMNLGALDAQGVLGILEVGDAIRRPERFREFLTVVSSLDPGFGDTTRSESNAARISLALDAARSVDAGAMARSLAGVDMASALHRARAAAISRAIGPGPLV